MNDPLENSNSMSTWMGILVWQGSGVRIVCRLLTVLTPALIWKCQLWEFLTKDYQNNLVSMNSHTRYLPRVFQKRTKNTCRFFSQSLPLNLVTWEFLLIKKLEIEKTKTTCYATFKTNTYSNRGLTFFDFWLFC